MFIGSRAVLTTPGLCTGELMPTIPAKRPPVLVGWVKYTLTQQAVAGTGNVAAGHAQYIVQSVQTA
jgi:hypothetical protein